MRASRKLRRALREAVAEAFGDTIDERLPEARNPPDTWPPETRNIFDALSDMQVKADDKIAEIFA